MKTISRKTISLLLAVMLALSLSVTAFATEIDQDDTDQTGNTKLTYSVDPTYTVTIPESVTVGGSAAAISASDVVVDEGKKVVVSITGTSGDNNAFTIASNDGSGTDTLEYTVKDSNSGTAYELNDAVLEVDPATDGTTGSVALTFALAAGETPLYSGTYSGTMTFTVAIS